MKFHIFVLIAVIFLFSNLFTASAQVDAVLGQITGSSVDSFAGGISGDGRFIVFESTGNIATYQPDNSDGNREIFLFDYAQRRIFQITHTKSLLTDATKAPTFDNIKVDIVNTHPVISNDGKWIVLSSNATCAYPGNGTIPPIVDTTNPRSFDPNATSSNLCLTGSGTSQINNLVNDGNTEIWLYQVPAVAPVASLSTGDEVPLTDLGVGIFTQVTNSFPSRLPIPGSTSSFAIIADDNHDSSIDDTGSAISFTSNRDLITGGNPFPSADNDEIFAYIPGSTPALKQITTTPRGSIANPIYNANSTITNLNGGGWRIAFLSNATTPVIGMTGSNTDNNEEIFFVDLDSNGTLGTNKKQVTTTARTNPGDVVNILNSGRRMSRDGRYIIFDSFADLANENSGANYPSFTTYIYDTTLTTNTFQRIIIRSDGDSNAAGGDLPRYPGFTDYDANRSPQTIVLQTRMNIRGSDGTVPSTSSDGLNDNAARPAQVYATSPVFIPPTTPPTPRPFTFTRLTKLPTPTNFLASIQPIPSNVRTRMTFNLGNTEVGAGNRDLSSEVMYNLIPFSDGTTTASFSFSTGATKIPVSPSPVPTPSPTPTPSATPTPSPTPTPSVTPTPTPSPTPQTSSAVQGISPGMLAILDYNPGTNQPVVARTGVGGVDRSFNLPIELSGVTMTINGVACGLKTVGQRQIIFVAPRGLIAADAGTVFPVVINNNGLLIKGNVTVVAARPDIFNKLMTYEPGGRAKVFNATNRVLTSEPFPIRTFKLRGSRLVPTVLRVYVTGVENPSATYTIRIGSVTIASTSIQATPTLVEPGIYTVDFTLPPEIAGVGDQPIVFTATVNGVNYTSRLDDTTSRLFIL